MKLPIESRFQKVVAELRVTKHIGSLALPYYGADKSATYVEVMCLAPMTRQ